MGITEIWEFLVTYFLILAWPMLKGLLWWAIAGLGLSFLLYLGPVKRGWLDVARQKRKWLRLVYGLVVFLVVLPLITLGGAITGARNGTCDFIVHEAHKYELTRSLGSVVVVPLVVAHLVVEEQITNPSWESMVQRAGQLSDLSFLLDARLRDRALGTFSTEFLQATLHAVGVDPSLSKSSLNKWLMGWIETILVTAVKQKLQLYESLFRPLQKDTDGKISFTSVSKQVGESFLRQTLLVFIASPFNSLRLQVLLLAGLSWLLTLGGIRLICWWLERRLRKKAAQPV